MAACCQASRSILLIRYDVSQISICITDKGHGSSRSNMKKPSCMRRQQLKMKPAFSFLPSLPPSLPPSPLLLRLVRRDTHAWKQKRARHNYDSACTVACIYETEHVHSCHMQKRACHDSRTYQLQDLESSLPQATTTPFDS